jgi:DNA-binding MarR family transcriptional regulator
VASDKTDLPATAAALNSGAIHLLRGLRGADRESGLTPARLSALSVLVFGGPSTLGRLASVEDVAGPTMTRIVDGLCTLGLARREPHPDSARAVRISATEKGELLMRAAARRRIEVISAALEALPAQERERLQAAAPALSPLASEVARALASGS